MDRIRHIDTPLGGVTLAGEGEALIGLWFDGQAHFAEALGPECEEKPLPVFDEAERWLRSYFSGEIPSFTPKLSLRGTAFRRAVWERLLRIPYGEALSYGALAAELDLPRGAVRAVASAVAHNPVSLIVPCHRVLGADGRLHGYAGGLERKAALLRLEGISFSF